MLLSFMLCDTWTVITVTAALNFIPDTLARLASTATPSAALT
jgi:hypothetical protein